MKTPSTNMKTAWNKLIATTVLFAATAAPLRAVTDTNYFTVEPTGKLVMSVDRGGIKVTTWDRNQVEVIVQREVHDGTASEAAALLKAHKVTCTQHGNEIIVEAQGPKSDWHSLFGRKPNLNVEFKIRVPEKFDLKLKTAGGGIKAAGLAGSVDVDTAGGGLEFSTIQGPVEGHTSGGGIRATDCSGTLKIDTSGGGIDIKNFSGPWLKAQTSGGGISADFASQPKSDCSLSTSGGGINVSVPETIAVNIDAGTSGGHVSSDLPVTVKGEHKGNELRGAINGGGSALVLKTSGGNVQVQKR
jgi:DUF4097 and DUF4098 domain-containing protein YvlB